MLRSLLILAIASTIATAPARAADPPPLRFSESLEVDGIKIPIPIELYLTARTQTQIAIKVAGNLRQLQRRLPQFLSDVAQDDCEMRVALQVDDAQAVGDDIRATGRVQVQLFFCNDAQEKSSRFRYFSHITTVSVLLNGGIRNNCLDAELKELALDPTGLVGGLLNITGLTRQIETTVRTEVNSILNQDQNCLELPEGLKLLEAKIESGGFRDFGGGELGFVIKASVNLQSDNVISLLELVYDRGLLDRSPPACRVANPCPLE